MPSVPAFLSARAMRRLDVALAIWAAFWIRIAAYTAYEVAALRTLSDTVVKAGAATQSTGHALAAIGHLPFVGGQISHLAAQAVAAGASARQRRIHGDDCRPARRPPRRRDRADPDRPAARALRAAPSRLAAGPESD